MTQPDSSRRVVIIGPPPTPNGNLHVGHLAGPYLAADVHARYLRASGRSVLYVTGTDDSQTYVVATARRQRRTPEELCRTSSQDIQRTLRLMGVAVDGFAPFDHGYRTAVLDFVGRLHAAGKFQLRTVRMPFSERRGEFLMEGLVCGDCPICLSESRGGLCETCGHPITPDGLLNPRSTVDPEDELVPREATILVLPMESYRQQLTDYYATRAAHWRPHIVQLAREALARPLPDFPITYPTAWGIPAPFPETPGQVLNAWVEGMPASMYCTAYAAAASGDTAEPAEALWRAEQHIELVYFLGFDNAYFWGMTHLALLLAQAGRYVVPENIVCNEFYELENEKFSTSKGHVVWAEDLVAEVPRDLVRFNLALTAPEHQRTNFSRAALSKITRERLVEPWNQLTDRLSDALSVAGPSEVPLAVSSAARARAATMLERFRLSYELSGYSLTRAADLIVVQLGRLRNRALRLGAPGDTRDGTEPGDLVLEVRALLAGASPILIDLAETAACDNGFELSFNPAAFEVAAVPPLRLPRLTAAEPRA